MNKDRKTSYIYIYERIERLKNRKDRKAVERLHSPLFPGKRE
jgi:hypothetical protein